MTLLDALKSFNDRQNADRERAETDARERYRSILQREARGSAREKDPGELRNCLRVLGLTEAAVAADLAALAEAERLTSSLPTDDELADLRGRVGAADADVAAAEAARNQAITACTVLYPVRASARQALADREEQARRIADAREALRRAHPRVFTEDEDDNGGT